MLQIVISGTYYKENVRYSSWNARQKKDCVYFYDYDEYIGYIIRHLTYPELQALRLKIYSKYKELIKFTRLYEKDVDGKVIEGWKLLSPVFDVDVSDFASLLNKDIRRNYFDWDNVREKYYYNSKFVNYVNLNGIYDK